MRKAARNRAALPGNWLDLEPWPVAYARKEKAIMPWEYLTGSLNSGENNDLQVFIKDQGWVDANDLGQDGWEMLSVVHKNPSDLTSNNVGIFKRFVEPDEEDEQAQ
jgi:hypothetical protein